MEIGILCQTLQEYTHVHTYNVVGDLDVPVVKPDRVNKSSTVTCRNLPSMNSITSTRILRTAVHLVFLLLVSVTLLNSVKSLVFRLQRRYYIYLLR